MRVAVAIEKVRVEANGRSDSADYGVGGQYQKSTAWRETLVRAEGTGSDLGGGGVFSKQADQKSAHEETDDVARRLFTPP